MAGPAIMPMPPVSPELAQRSVTIQQPPKLIIQKKVIMVKKIRQEPKLINGMKEICIPHVTTETMILRIPKITWVSQVIKEPSVSWSQQTYQEPVVECKPQVVIEPKEICQAILCQPTPQVIKVPKPVEFCCYATGPSTLNCKPTDKYSCPPCPPYVPPGPASPMFPPCPKYCLPRPGVGFGSGLRR